MGIDGIGKGGGKPPVSGVDRPGSAEVGGVSGPTTEFKVSRTNAAEAISGGSLDQVRSGAISVSQYLDNKVSEATSHLTDRLSSEQLAFVRQSLREQLSSDPALIDLVKAATGSLPPPTE
jgi:hypothetical protein